MPRLTPGLMLAIALSAAAHPAASALGGQRPALPPIRPIGATLATTFQ